MVLVLALAAAPALGDDLILKGGGRLTGEIVKETETTVTVDIGAGTMTVQKSSVVRVETSTSPLQEYRAQAASLAPEDVEGWKELGRWAAGQGLNTQAREAFNKVKAIVPDDPEANRALGLVLLDGQWVTEKESFTARGFVEFEGEWMTPSERQAIVEERRASEDADRQELAALIESDRVQQAEQEALEAAEDAEDDFWGVDSWGYGSYGYYGYAPGVWPSRPVDLARPGTRPVRPGTLPAGGRR